MSTNGDIEIFLVTFPGAEALLCAEARDKGFIDPTPIKGGVTVRGGWPEVWRANLELRGASRVLARVGAFRAFHLAQLDKRARRVAWGEIPVLCSSRHQSRADDGIAPSSLIAFG
jgi:putative N6-adenine-specific DNA methylase